MAPAGARPGAAAPHRAATRPTRRRRLSAATLRPQAAGNDARVLTAYLATLVGREPGALLEIRARSASGMSQRSCPSAALSRAARELLDFGRRTDVYVGCLPRHRRAGGRDVLQRGRALWAECDDAAAAAALATFEPRPSMIVRRDGQQRARLLAAESTLRIHS